MQILEQKSWFCKQLSNLPKKSNCAVDTMFVMSNVGFTSEAIKLAKTEGIELISSSSLKEEEIPEVFKDRVLEVRIQTILVAPHYTLYINLS